MEQYILRTVSDRTPGITTKLRDLKDKYSFYVEPDESFEYGVPFFVLKDGLKLYQGPDERYSTVAYIPADTRLNEKGVHKSNNEWLFTEYKGQYGWIKTIEDDNRTVTIYFDEYLDMKSTIKSIIAAASAAFMCAAPVLTSVSSTPIVNSISSSAAV